MGPARRSRRIRTVLLLGAAALAPVALGAAMHLEHEATLRACEQLLAEANGTGRQLAVHCVESETCTPSEPEPVVEVEKTSPPSTPARLGDPGAFSFVVDMPEPHVVLASEIDESWIAGEPVLERGEDYEAIATRPLAIDRLPLDVRARSGRRVRLFGADGELCSGVLGEPRLVAELSGDPVYLADSEDDGTEAFDAAQTWEHGRRLLVARVHAGGPCKGALWARDSRFEAPGTYASVPGIDRTAADIRSAYLRMPEVRKRRAEFDEYVAGNPVENGKRPAWTARVSSTAWTRSGAPGAMFVFRADGEEFYGCGGLAPSWGMVAVDAEGKPVRSDFVGEDTPLAVVDVDRDGVAEAIAEGWFGARRLIAIGDAGPTEVVTLPEVPFYGCPC